MPELPEVETVARQLAPQIVGRTIRGLEILDPRLRDGPTPRVARRRIVDVTRSGKRVLIGLAPGPYSTPLWLAVHLRMTGRLLWRARRAGPSPDHLRARLTLDRGMLLFADTRRFGTWSWYRRLEDTAPAGIDPLSAELTLEKLEEMTRDSTQNLKAWLLRQDRLVGLGNIYASEILHSARLSPLRPAGSLERKELRRLRSSTRRILERAIRNCGTTFSDFQDTRGLEGSYQQYLAVYDRTGEGCTRCREPIERIVQQQRSTFYCPACQG